jgi:beta-lactam-binding protein with PASTA domain
LISLGPPRATVPNLVNQPFDAAQVALQEAGFKVARRDQTSKTVPAGLVISQDPPPGDVDPGTTVTLIVSQGDVVEFPTVIGTSGPAPRP